MKVRTGLKSQSSGWVQDMFISAGGDGSRFDASHIFAPHITLGFTAASATKGLFAPTDLFLEQVPPPAPFSVLHVGILSLISGGVGHCSSVSGDDQLQVMSASAGSSKAGQAPDQPGCGCKRCK